MKILIALAIVLAIFLLALFAMVRAKGDQGTVRKRVALLAASAEETGQNLTKESVFLTKLRKLLGVVSARLRAVHTSEYFDLKMQQADWPLFGSEFQVLVAVITVAVSLLTLLLTLQFKMFVIAVAVTPLICMMYLKLQISRRQSAFMGQLGDTLIMISNALRAGFSFLQAMEYISHEMGAPIGVEFQKVVQEMNLGSSLETALENMNRRVESKDFDLVVTAVLIQRQVGGNLSQVLDSISTTITERIRMRREVMSLTAQGRLSGAIVGALPFFMVGMLLSINPGYFDTVTSDETGRFLIGVAVTLELVAVLAIRHIVNIKM